MNIAPCYLMPAMPAGLEPLAELALDMRWSWNHAADRLWQELDPELWELTHNPWLILQSMSEQRLRELAQDSCFLGRLDDLTREHHQALTCECWYDAVSKERTLNRVAYFCMEFGLTEVLPIYSGGLGILAGDTLKTASDLGVPMVGIGLLYQQGYFRQSLDAEGNQQEFYPYNDPMQMPVIPVRDAAGEWLRIEIQLPGRVLYLQVWQAIVGRVRLYLLDSNDPLNTPADRGITGELYGGGTEMRLQQEIVLGIGGWRILEALDLEPEVCHLNEGHAAFAVLERAAVFARRHRCDFHTALTATRAGTLFTTHTPLAVGFDQFPPPLIQQYLSPYCEQSGIDIEHLLELGRSRPEAADEPFNMAWLAVRGSIRVNAVSRLHREVSRSIYRPLFPRWPLSEIPIGHVTNGVHIPSWDSAETDRFWTELCGKDRWREDLKDLGQMIKKVSDEELWALRTEGRRQLIQYARRRLQRQRAESGAPPGKISEAGDLLDPNTLTLSFARRFTTYKRPNLMLHDRERLARILTDPQRPVQLVIAGKAHPKDKPGKAMVRAWIKFIRDFDLQYHVVFLNDYDIRMAEQLTQGADVWINTPRRHWEACGTSGMKVLANGGINFSELDGWWAEAWRPEVGWTIGDRHAHQEKPLREETEAERLYRILEEEIVPCFYERDLHGVPREWVARLRTSMAELTPQFSANRMLREYVQNFYFDLSRHYLRRKANGARMAREIDAWGERLRHHWPLVRFGDVEVRSDEAGHHFLAAVYFNDLSPDAARVELFADNQGAGPEIHPMSQGEPLAGAINGYLYHCTVTTQRPASDYTPRIQPHHPDAHVPIEAQQILWHH